MQIQQNQSVNSKCVCSNCQAPLSVNPMAEVVKCEYCDTVHSVASLLDEPANVREAKVQAKIAGDAEAARRMWADENSRREHAWRLHKERADEIEAFKKSKLCKALWIGIAFSALMALGSIGQFFLAGVVSCIQVAVFVASWLMGMQFIEETRKDFHLVLAAVGFLLYAVFLAAAGLGL